MLIRRQSLLLLHLTQFQYLNIIPTLIVPLQLNIDIPTTCQKHPLETQSVQRLFSHVYFTVLFFKSLKVCSATVHLSSLTSFSGILIITVLGDMNIFLWILENKIQTQNWKLRTDINECDLYLVCWVRFIIDLNTLRLWFCYNMQFQRFHFWLAAVWQGHFQGILAIFNICFIVAILWYICLGLKFAHGSP